MSPKSFRRSIAALFLASITAAAPGHAFDFGRRPVDHPARSVSARGIPTLLLEWIDLVSGQTKAGGGMDPNGGDPPPTPTPAPAPTANGTK
jgi:hypothetical protein